ncbi:N-acetylmuramoyl-L-alanine amidase [Kocuria sp. JC486]|uniref:peptidoglycan recognition protein family protein n=1 Tax=Kocuria sp. JC486 TaxID=1970736 RepID=UPI00141D7AE7|nr:N-acetylmuramoyl-L-alanine amidase [Kocuria sp. JC486]NHU86077.1 N-acetylmuramoyl-L-alanine amidase [Kocuria sp. JC486]
MSAHEYTRLTRRTLLKASAVIGGLGAAGAVAQAPAFAAIAPPSIISTATWGAKPAKRALTTLKHRPTYLVIHHMDSANTSDFSVGAAHSIARQVQSWHFARGWADSGQQFSISRGGHALEGRHGSLRALQSGTSFILGAHVANNNSKAVGIECEGRYGTELPPQKLYATLVHLATYICQQYGIPVANIVPHRHFSDTSCCGDAFVAALPTLRSDVSKSLAAGRVIVSPVGSTTPPQPTPTSNYPLLKKGATGAVVTRLQKLLTARGHSPGAADGVFGDGTLGAVKAFQRAIGTEADGVVGPKTWGALEARAASNATLKQGSSGNNVRALQKALNAVITANLAVDGQFGPGTHSAVRNYQRSRGLTDDGIVGAKTWGALKGGR